MKANERICMYDREEILSYKTNDSTGEAAELIIDYYKPDKMIVYNSITQ